MKISIRTSSMWKLLWPKPRLKLPPQVSPHQPHPPHPMSRTRKDHPSRRALKRLHHPHPPTRSHLVNPDLPSEEQLPQQFKPLPRRKLPIPLHPPLP